MQFVIRYDTCMSYIRKKRIDCRQVTLSSYQKPPEYFLQRWICLCLFFFRIFFKVTGVCIQSKVSGCSSPGVLILVSTTCSVSCSASCRRCTLLCGCKLSDHPLTIFAYIAEIGYPIVPTAEKSIDMCRSSLSASLLPLAFCLKVP